MNLLERIGQFLNRKQESAPQPTVKLSDFLIAEYNNIAEAHFKMIETISEFFRNYLTIISVPITLAVAIIALGKEAQNNIINIVADSAFIFFLLFLIISLVGVMMLWYIVNLRMDALMYARTINAIRKYFYDLESGIDVAIKHQMRVLPQSPRAPAYHEFRFFGPVVLAFAFLNSLYFLFAVTALAVHLGRIDIRQLGAKAFANLGLLVVSGIFLIGHYFLYRQAARYREFSYLRSNIIGVDIDGVLNEHRAQFCRILEARLGKKIQEDQITALPVRNVKDLNVTKSDEITVFNTPEYWTEMPVIQDAVGVLNSLRNALQMKVFIFTLRPWPDLSALTGDDIREMKSNWIEQSRTYAEKVFSIQSWLRRSWAKLAARVAAIVWRVAPRFLRACLDGTRLDPMVRITRLWLREHGFQFDRMVVEKAGENVADPRARVRNRFHEARTKLIRYFVEDDLLKARKLAFICDIVFLIDHPYNRSGDLPSNVIRVNSWDEIYQHMKALS